VITVLAGGVGAARFLQGLLAVHPPSDVTIVSNVGDDAEFFGLRVCPDIDIVLYHLAGLADEERGFGLRGDTFRTLEALARLGYDPWFRLGDRDLATCIARSDLLRRGYTISQATGEIARALGVPARILPVTDDPMRTVIRTDPSAALRACPEPAEGTGSDLLEFQEYFVKRGARDPVREIIFRDAETARPAPGVLEAIGNAQAVLLAPSNPLVSVGPILAVPGVREALRQTPARVAAVSPIVGGAALKGPAAQMLRDQGLEASALTIARLYRDFLDLLVIDEADAALHQQIEALGLEVAVADTIMSSMEKKAALARKVLHAAGLRKG